MFLFKHLVMVKERPAGHKAIEYCCGRHQRDLIVAFQYLKWGYKKSGGALDQGL